MPRLRCLAGPSPDDLHPITVNSSIAHPIKSDLFEGKVSVFIKLESKKEHGGFELTDNEVVDDYFLRPDKKGITWSIQVQGESCAPFILVT